MKIDAGPSHPFASQRTQLRATTDRSVTTSFSAALTQAQANGTKRADFTSMTRQEMRDWSIPKSAVVTCHSMTVVLSWP